MKKRSFLHALFGMTLAGTLIFSCTSENIDANKGNSETVNALMSTEQTVDFKISYDVPDGYRVTFDVYAENPFVITADGFGKKPGVSPIVSAMTDEKGNYHISRVISGGVEEVFVVSNSAGVPALLHGTIQGKTVEPTEIEMSSKNRQPIHVQPSRLLSWAAGTSGDVRTTSTARPSHSM